MKSKAILLFLLLLPAAVWGQDSLYRQSSSKRAAASKLSKSLETSKPEGEIAADYMQLARELMTQKEYARAENYFAQAVGLYNKGQDRESLAAAYRELAKALELQHKHGEALANYTNAAKASTQEETIEMNRNDASRLRHPQDLESQATYIQSNINLFTDNKNKPEAASAYQQMAEVKLKMDDKEGAIEELQNALKHEDAPAKAIQIKEEIAKTYVADEQFDKGIATLQEIYDLALQNHQTMQARAYVEQLAQSYLEQKDQRAALKVYAQFIARLDTLIRNDSTLVDEKYFQVHEERIARLERERALQSQLIRKSQLFNYILIGFIVAIGISLAFIIRALHSISLKNKKIALQSLRREMNPHFIFNSLNSVNHFIAQNNELEANRYLSSYSRLMRNMMENSNKDFIPLSIEIEQLKEYLELEQMRFRDKFVYEIYVDEALDTDALSIPNMLIQPQLENAVWHGLRYKEGDGRLKLSIVSEGNSIRVTVDDNGIGLKQSRELKTEHQKQHRSRGLTNTQERIGLLNRLYRIHIAMNITDKTGEGTGVSVTLLFPVLNKKQMTDEHPA